MTKFDEKCDCGCGSVATRKWEKALMTIENAVRQSAPERDDVAEVLGMLAVFLENPEAVNIEIDIDEVAKYLEGVPGLDTHVAKAAISSLVNELKKAAPDAKSPPGGGLRIARITTH